MVTEKDIEDDICTLLSNAGNSNVFRSKYDVIDYFLKINDKWKDSKLSDKYAVFMINENNRYINKLYYRARN